MEVPYPYWWDAGGSLKETPSTHRSSKKNGTIVGVENPDNDDDFCSWSIAASAGGGGGADEDAPPPPPPPPPPPSEQGETG